MPITCHELTTLISRDGMHLGPEAHKMIGQGIAQDIADSQSDSWFAHEQDDSKESGPKTGPDEKPPAS